MQLILLTDNTEINIKDKMATLEHSASEKFENTLIAKSDQDIEDETNTDPVENEETNTEKEEVSKPPKFSDLANNIENGADKKLTNGETVLTMTHTYDKNETTLTMTNTSDKIQAEEYNSVSIPENMSDDHCLNKVEVKKDVSDSKCLAHMSKNIEDSNDSKCSIETSENIEDSDDTKCSNEKVDQIDGLEYSSGNNHESDEKRVVKKQTDEIFNMDTTVTTDIIKIIPQKLSTEIEFTVGNTEPNPGTNVPKTKDQVSYHEKDGSQQKTISVNENVLDKMEVDSDANNKELDLVSLTHEKDELQQKTISMNENLVDKMEVDSDTNDKEIDLVRMTHEKDELQQEAISLNQNLLDKMEVDADTNDKELDSDDVNNIPVTLKPLDNEAIVHDSKNYDERIETDQGDGINRTENKEAILDEKRSVTCTDLLKSVSTLVEAEANPVAAEDIPNERHLMKDQIVELEMKTKTVENTQKEETSNETENDKLENDTKDEKNLSCSGFLATSTKEIEVIAEPTGNTRKQENANDTSSDRTDMPKKEKIESHSDFSAPSSKEIEDEIKTESVENTKIKKSAYETPSDDTDITEVEKIVSPSDFSAPSNKETSKEIEDEIKTETVENTQIKETIKETPSDDTDMTEDEKIVLPTDFSAPSNKEIEVEIITDTVRNAQLKETVNDTSSDKTEKIIQNEKLESQSDSSAPSTKEIEDERTETETVINTQKKETANETASEDTDVTTSEGTDVTEGENIIAQSDSSEPSSKEIEVEIITESIKNAEKKETANDTSCDKTENMIKDDKIISRSDISVPSSKVLIATEEKTVKCDQGKADGIIEDAKIEDAKADPILKENETKTCQQPVRKEEDKDSFKLSNTLDILSDDEEEKQKTTEIANDSMLTSEDKQTINLDDDDDIMLIDDDISSKTKDKVNSSPQKNDKNDERIPTDVNLDAKKPQIKEPSDKKESTTPADVSTKRVADSTETVKLSEKTTTPKIESKQMEENKPLIPANFFKKYKKNLSDMTRDDLEEFCVLKIVEGIIDRSSLSELKAKLKIVARSAEEFKKKATTLAKQNRDLQVVLKSVQEEQKKNSNTPITPLKITRSVGMQVLMTDKNRRKTIGAPISAPRYNNNNPASNSAGNSANNSTGNSASNSPSNSPSPFKQPKTNKVLRAQKQTGSIQQIPVPRLVPASNIVKTPSQTNTPVINKASPTTNGVKVSPPAPKPEKRTHNRIQSVTVDLTDDEPPAKVMARTVVPPVRLVPPQNLLAPRQPQTPSSPRKVFIPITGGQSQIRPGQTIMVKSGPPPGARPRLSGPVRAAPNPPRMPRIQARHPAPLPDAMKQYQPPNWRALPPAPDLKLSKVENGIVISWKIEGYDEGSYEEIASYQLFAYQETSTPPSTSLWKKIGDVKALPLPMACTLTQFMAGYKYYFAVRAVDIRSRLGPFSLPGSILLLNKM